MSEFMLSASQDVRFSSAAELLTHATRTKGFDYSAPLNVDFLATKVLSLQVIYDFSLEDRDIVGEICFDEGNPVVRINPIQNSYEPRRRFTLAHEIGHYCLHRAVGASGFKDSRKTMSRTESYWDRYESEANGFAAQLLMPKDLILAVGQQVLALHKEKTASSSMAISLFVSQMADRFQVSNKAMEYRLTNIGVIEA